MNVRESNPDYVDEYPYDYAFSVAIFAARQFGIPWAAIAEEAGLSEPAVRARAARVRKHIHELNKT